MNRVLKLGATLVITTPNDEDLSISTKFCPECGAIFHEWQHVRTWTPRTLADALLPYGFRPTRLRTVDFAATSSLRHMVAFIWRELTGKRRPHMIGTFQKVSV